MPAICLFTFASQELWQLFPQACHVFSYVTSSFIAHCRQICMVFIIHLQALSLKLFPPILSLFSAFSRACLSFWTCFSTSSLGRKRLLVKGLATLATFLNQMMQFFAIRTTLPYTGDYETICRQCLPFRIFGWTCQIRVIATFMGKCSMEYLCNRNATT